VPVTGSAARPSFSDPVTGLHSFEDQPASARSGVLKDGTTQLVSEQDRGIFTLSNVKHGPTPRGLFQKTGDVIRGIYLFIAPSGH
jgi:hypothetical protein